MATSLLLAAPLCFRRHGSTPFHQQPDEAAVGEFSWCLARLQFDQVSGCHLSTARGRLIFLVRAEVSDEEESTFDEAAAEPEGCNLLPLKRIIFSYHLTLVLAYRCLVKEDDREAPSFLIESVEKDSEDTKNVVRSIYIYPSIQGGARANQGCTDVQHITVVTLFGTVL
jgi:hypothetical protein